ncbi:glycosyltransferase family 2 protein [Cohnella abietis]|uniref:Glycosyl transferase n=1 Tax=Cohnella abietis TaxID=2507935 RepID=A0A3T1DDE6_9BACL|nr:glycosyltransferase family 2 protein [Cohnella abietis]BBI36176.1 glycosyl transferase [Cohnella abietis]
MKAKITIVTPSYNQGIFLRRTLDSVFNQNIEGLEYLVFDGGSKDETVEILESYGDRLSFVSGKDGGQSDAVNKGLLAAHGEIIGWLNSDDVYYPGSIESVLKVFEENPDVDVIYGKADHIDENDLYMEDYYTEQWDYERLKEVCFLCQPAVFFRKSVVDTFGVLNKELNYCMDYEYWMRIGAKKPFYFLNQKLAGSRLYSDNKTLGNRKAVHEEIIVMLKGKLRKAPKKWMYNLSHVITEESGYTRANASDNYKFVKALVLTSMKVFLKYNRHIPLTDIRAMMSWLKHAYVAKREAKRNENRL